MMVAFAASPLGRLGLRHFLAGGFHSESAQTIVRGFAGIFLMGGLSVTAGVGIGLVLAWDTALTQTWVVASVALMVIAGTLGVVIEDRWLKRLSRAKGDAFNSIRQERGPFLAALASPLIWLLVLWLMIEKPA
jgi:UDP-N-acetylmuramyl pentapeptide phosphotransferase/UDP-N-acetylglucosamine-1-phosphate transferase